jgi:hypothetical protein
MKELENKQQINQMEAPARYEAPSLEIIEVVIPNGFGGYSDPGGEGGNPDGY